MPKPRKNILFYLLSLLYGGVTAVRNFLFDTKLLPSVGFVVPIIGVGNLAAGGTGKTPHVEFLLKILSPDFKTAVLSRGYKRSTKGFLLADQNPDAGQIGDEPYQIFCKFPQTVVAVDEKRVHGAKELLHRFPETDVILLDDSFQHRHIQAGLSILLTDFRLLFTEDSMLPYGTLREYARNSKRADIVIVSKCPKEAVLDKKIFHKKLNLLPEQELYFSTFDYGKIYPVFEKNIEAPEINRTTTVFIVTGIENPEPMHRYLETVTERTVKFNFPDHYDFTKNDLEEIEQKFNETEGEKIIVTTEKDAARLKSNPFIPEKIKNNIFALPLEVKILLGEEEKLTKKIYDYVRKNSTNS